MRFLVPFLTAFIVLTGSPLSADTTITYQGQLKDNDGPLDGTVEMAFSLFDTESGGSPLGPLIEFEDVEVSGGLFQVDLDFGFLEFDGDPFWIEIEVGGQPLSSRQRISAAPMAQSALLAQSARFAHSVPESLAPWSSNFPHIYFKRSGGRVGIGTDSPTSSLQVSGTASFGDESNETQAANAFVGGGSGNVASAPLSFVGGGVDNTASNWHTFVGGGENNVASISHSFVGGGKDNAASGQYSFIAGGEGNATSATRSFVGGGQNNTVSGAYGFVGGGSGNVASGTRSFAAGTDAKAEHDGTFVWSDYLFGGFPSTGDNQFLIRARGGVGINTNSPDAPLHVASDNNWNLSTTEGDFKVGDDTYRFKLGVSLGGAGAGNVRLRAQGGSNKLILGSNESDVLVIHDEDGVDPGADNQYSLGSSTSRWTSVWATSGTVSSSDRRLKTNIVDYDGALATLQNLRPVTYRWKDHPKSLARPGLIAQEVREILPGIVEEPVGEEGKLGLRYAELIPVVIAALQEQNQSAFDHFDQLAAENLELRERLAAVESDNAQLHRKISRLSTEREDVAELENRLAALESLLLEDRQVAGEWE